jgi:hypothetical protein
MLTVQVREDYAAILTPLQESVDQALRRYALEKARARADHCGRSGGRKPTDIESAG